MEICSGMPAIEEMRWGRFISETDSIVWISWKGNDALTMVIRNGVERQCSRIDESLVEFDQGTTLSLSEAVSLRQGRLGETVLDSHPIIKSILPVQLRDIHEQKWRSRGKLIKNCKCEATGWVIHECVRFNSLKAGTG